MYFTMIINLVYIKYLMDNRPIGYIPVLRQNAGTCILT